MAAGPYPNSAPTRAFPFLAYRCRSLALGGLDLKFKIAVPRDDDIGAGASTKVCALWRPSAVLSGTVSPCPTATATPPWLVELPSRAPIVPTPLATPTPSARTAASAVSAAHQAAGFRDLDNPAAQAHEDVKSFLKGVEREAPPRRQRERRSRSGADTGLTHSNLRQETDGEMLG